MNFWLPGGSPPSTDEPIQNAGSNRTHRMESKNDCIPDDEKWGKALATKWCAIHGEKFCNAILDGKKRRDDVDENLRRMRNLLSYGTLEKNDAHKRREGVRSRGSLENKMLELEALA